MSAVSVRASRVGARRHTHAGALRAVGRFVRALLDAAASAPAGAVWHAPVPPAVRRRDGRAGDVAGAGVPPGFGAARRHARPGAAAPTTLLALVPLALVPLAVVPLAVAWTAPPQGAARRPAPEPAVRATVAPFVDALNALDVARTDAHSADDVTAFVPAARPDLAVGRAAVTGIFRRFADRVRPTTGNVRPPPAHGARTMPPRIPGTAALVVVDVQDGFDAPGWGARNNPDAERNVARLLAAWRAAGRPVAHVQHASRDAGSPLHPHHPGHAIKREAAPRPGEPVYRKTVNGAFIGTTLERDLRRDGVDAVLLVGLTTNHCVSTTARMAANLGFATYVVSDATAAFARPALDGRVRPADEVHWDALSDLQGEFAEVVDTAGVLGALGATTPPPRPLPSA